MSDTQAATDGPVTVERRGALAILWVDNPPVNALSHAVRVGLLDAIRMVEADGEVTGAVIACRGRTFIAGADVREFGQPPREPHLPDVIAAIEACPKPIVAAIHGTALGGGLEVALGCHARVMASDAKAGLPEVTLGVIPGAGGTQRLPRLVGMAEAAAMVTTGRPVDAAKALAIGLVDRVADSGGMDAPLAEASDLLAGLDGAVPDGARLSTRPPVAASEAFEAIARKAAGSAPRMGHAPAVAVEALRAAEKPFPEGMAIERALFLERRGSDEAGALRHIFFAERAAAKSPIEAEARPVERVGVIGAGTMGTGIALALLGAGLPVTLVETSAEGLERGLARIGDTLDGMVAKGRMTAEAAAARRARVSGTLRMADLGNADLIVEAAFEDMEVKRAIFGELGDAAKPGASLATNTSYLDVDAIAAASGRPADVLGLHFFSPAHVMKLLEIVRGRDTADDALATGHALAKRLGKLPVVASNAHGFIGNRVFSAYRRQAEFMVEEGASPAEVDAAMRGFGMAMGPFEVADLAGLDIAAAVRRMSPPGPGERGAPLADALCAGGRLGRKTIETTGGGWYDYADGKPVPSPEVDALIVEHRAASGIERRAFTADEIVERLLAAMANAGAHAVGEGVARSPDDVDVVLVNGYGFPRWRGGPMHAAEAGGWTGTLDAAARMCEAGGKGWRVAPWLRERALANGRARAGTPA